MNDLKRGLTSEQNSNDYTDIAVRSQHYPYIGQL
jgi:hypothetical protein